MRLAALPLRWKMMVPAAAAGAATLLALAVSLVLLRRATAELNAVEAHHFPALHLSEQLEARLATLQRQLQDAAALEDQGAVSQADELLAAIDAEIDGAPADAVTADERKALRAAFQGYYDLARPTTLRMIAKAKGDDLQEPLRAMTARYTAVREDLAARTATASKAFAAGLDSARGLQGDGAIALALLLVAAAALAGGLAFSLARAAARPLEALAAAARRIAEGDLTHDVAVDAKDEVGALAESFGTMVQRLRVIVGTLKQSSGELATVASTLSEATKAQRGLIERQATGVTETTVSTRELEQASALAANRAASVLEVARRAAEMSASGQTAAEQSVQGIKQIQGTVEGIVAQSTRLIEQARQVGDIVETVRDLATQSHVLSLNASIEAVRAGEAGKSFGVVAAEVRALAEQSGQSAARIGKIVQDILAAIGTTLETTEKGSRGMEGSTAQIRASGDSLREIGGIVRETSDAALQIAAAVQQQSTGITQIASAMQDVAKGMEEAVQRIQVLERSADDLTGAAARIADIASGFRV